jgi:hypothetical protein
MWTYLASIVFGAKDNIRNRRLPYVVLSFTILAFSTASAVIAAWCLYQLLLRASPGPENVRQSLTVLLELDKTFWLYSHLMRDICVWIADAMLVRNLHSDIHPSYLSLFIQVYRCWIVWSGNFWIAWGPVALNAGALAVGIRTWTPIAYRPVNETDIATLVLTILVNVVVTALLSLRLQKAQRNVESALVSGNTVYLGVIVILVESAAPMAVTGIGLVIASLIPTINGWKAATIFDIFFKNFAVRQFVCRDMPHSTTVRSWHPNSSSFECQPVNLGQVEPTPALGSRAKYVSLDLPSHRLDNQSKTLKTPRYVRLALGAKVSTPG